MGLGAKIGQGRTAELFLWDEGQVIKLFYPEFPKESVEKEAEIHTLIQKTKLAVPKLYERVEVDGRHGLVYQQVEGCSLLHELAKRPWKVVQIARLFARLHSTMHKKKVPKLPSLREELEKLVRQTQQLSQRKKWLTIQTLKELTDGQALCHGDFHPDNLLLTKDEPMIIDWLTSTRGNPCADVARTVILLKTAELPTEEPALIRWSLTAVRWVLLFVYLRTYCKLTKASKDEIKTWEIPVAVARLNEKIPEGEKDKLISLIDKLLASKYSMKLNDT